MPIKIKSCSASHLLGAAVPSLGKSTPASYKFIVEKVKELCAANNLTIVEEKFKATSDQSFASGVYILASEAFKDEDYDLIFAWSSSYTKLTKFQCGFGVKFKNSPYPDNYVISDDAVESVKRYKDDPEGATETVLKTQFANWQSLYQATIYNLSAMAGLTVDKLNLSRIIGTLYFEDLINNKQLTLIKDRVHYDSDMSYRALYAGITSTMYDLHPKLWLETQAKVFSAFTSEIDIILNFIKAGKTVIESTPETTISESVKDSAQIDLYTAIEEVEKETITPVEEPVVEEQVDQIPESEMPVKGDDLTVESDPQDNGFFDFDL